MSSVQSAAAGHVHQNTWFAAAIWTLLLFWPTVARRGRLDSPLDERSLSRCMKNYRSRQYYESKVLHNTEVSVVNRATTFCKSFFMEMIGL